VPAFIITRPLGLGRAPQIIIFRVFMSYPLKRSRSFKRIPTNGGIKRRASSAARQKAARTAISSQKRVSNFIARDVPSVLYGFSGIARKRKALLKYAGEVTLTATGPANISHLFRLNSLHDPDYTGVGHQPLAHDQWSQLYNRYTVLKSTIKATPIRDANSNVVPGLLRVGILDESGGVSTSAMTVAEDTRYTDWVHSGILGGGYAAGGKRGDFIRQEVDMAKFFNVKDVTTAGDPDTYGSVFGASPADTCYAAVVISPVNGNTPGATNVFVELEFEVEFHDPKQLTAS